MDEGFLMQQVENLQQRLNNLQQQAQRSPASPDLAAELLGELEQAIKLLRAAGERMQKQSAELQAAQAAAQAERSRYQALLVERKEAEEALRQEHHKLELERKRLRSILDIIPAGLWVVDENGEILVQSAMSRTIWAEDALPEDGPRHYKGWWAQSGRQLGPQDWSRIRAVTRGETSLNEEINIQAFDGTRKTILSSAVPIKDEDEKIAGAVVLNMDISRRKAQEVLLKEERARIARELHDSLAQNLYFVGLKLDYIRKRVTLAPQTAIAELHTLKQTIQANIQEVRRAIFALRPVELDELGFGPALQKYVQEFGEQVGLETSLTVAGAELLPVELHPVIFRLTQEGLTNIAKHAQARNVWIEMSFEAHRMGRLKIQDDGIGFEPRLLSKNGGKMGLRQMRERVARLNGRFKLESAPGQGTTLHIEIPLPGGLI